MPPDSLKEPNHYPEEGGQSVLARHVHRLDRTRRGGPVGGVHERDGDLQRAGGQLRDVDLGADAAQRRPRRDGSGGAGGAGEQGSAPAVTEQLQPGALGLETKVCPPERLRASARPEFARSRRCGSRCSYCLPSWMSRVRAPSPAPASESTSLWGQLASTETRETFRDHSKCV